MIGNITSQLRQQTAPLQLTTARWFNRKTAARDVTGQPSERWSKVLAHTGPLTQFAYGTDTPSDWNHRLQWCVISAPHTGTITIDVDSAAGFARTRLSQLVSRADAWSERDADHFHILVDARSVPRDQWPKQGPVSGGDIKSNGWVPVPGSEHYSGQLYNRIFLPDGTVRVVTATPEIIAAMAADQAAFEAAGGRAAMNGSGGGGTGGGDDGRVAAEVCGWVRQAVNAGQDPMDPVIREWVYACWQTVAVPLDPSWDYTRDDFDRHYGDLTKGAVHKVLATLSEDAPPEAVAWARQRAETVAAEAKAGPEMAAAKTQAGLPAEETGLVLSGTVVRPQVIFPKTGLDALAAARWITGQGPLRYGIDDQLWAYQDGVWKPGEDHGSDIVHKRAAYLLGGEYRQAHESNTREMIRAMAEPLRCDPVPGVINFRNGLLHWQEEPLPLAPEPHDPAVLTTVQMAVDWNPAALCPKFDTFLSEVLAEEDVARMWEVIGYLMMSGNPLHKMFLLHGKGFNGKGALLRVITALLGQGSVSSVSLHSLADERFTRVGLLGRLANICGDIDATYIERTGLLKQLTGEDQITAEHKFRKPTQFTCWAVPVFSANEMPTSSDTSYGWRERWEVFGFPNVFLADPGFEAPLHSQPELEGVAAHGIRSLRELMGRTPPALRRTGAGDTAKADFIAHQDPLHGWLSEACWRQQTAWTDRRFAHSGYMQWCANSGARALGKTKFYALMREQFAEVKKDGWDGYSGLRLRV